MNGHTHTLKWATDCLNSKGYTQQHSHEIIVKTPWSNVIRFSTSNKDIYLKQTPPSISIEPKIIQLLADQFHATIHHDVTEQSQIYHQLLDACFENWLELATKKQLLEAFILSRKLWPIYSTLAYYRLMMSVDLQALKSFYANRPNRFAGFFREDAASI